MAADAMAPFGEEFNISPMLTTGIRGPKSIIEEYDVYGFTVNNVRARGAVLVFPHHMLLCSPREQHDVTIDSLAAVTLAEPQVEMLVIGAGDRMTQQLDPALVDYFRKQGTVVELMNTVNACATFNILNAEDRNVAGALLCPPADDGDLIEE